jgi:hypothetical protein
MSFKPDRRAMLSLALGALPAPWLAACGGHGGRTPSSDADVEVARFLSYGGQDSPVLERSGPVRTDDPANGKVIAEIPLMGRLASVARGADRFGAADLALRFGPGASAELADLRALGDRAVALTLWMRSDEISPQRLMGWRDVEGREFALETGGAAGLAAYDVAAGELLNLGGAGRFGDGQWHHVLVQSVDRRIEVIVDGAWRAVGPGQRPMAAFQALSLGDTAGAGWSGSMDTIRLHDRTFGMAGAASLAYGWADVLAGHRADSYAAFLPFHGDARNQTGSGVDGVTHGTQWSSDRFGNESSALRIEAPDAFVEMNDSFDPVPDDLAVALWLRTTSTGAMAALSITMGTEADLRIDCNAAAAITVGSNGSTLATHGPPGGLADGRWHFVLVQRVGARLELFVDREKVAEGTLAGTLFGPGSRVRVGRGVDGADVAHWRGDVDDVQVYVRTFTATEVAALEWLQFLPRDGAGLLPFNGRLWLLGGWNTEVRPSTNSEVWSSGDGRVWRFEGDAPWEGRHTSGWLVHGERLWVIGGDRNRGHYQNDVWSTPDGKTWERVDDAPPWADRALFMTASFRGRIWVFGGAQIFEDPASSRAFNDVYSSEDGRQWRLETSSAPWPARGIILGATVFDDKLWVIGGGSYDVRTYRNDVWCSSDGRNWEQVLEAAPWAPRQYHNVVVHRGLLWVVGGATAANPGGEGDAWASPDGRQWFPMPPPPWLPRHAASVASWREDLWLGCGSSSRLYSDVWKLQAGA